MNTKTLRALSTIAILFVSLGVMAQHTTRILAIGNSFSRDAIEQNLWDLANANGEKSIIGNLYIGGCPIVTHVENSRSDSAAYVYRKIGTDGVRVETPAKRLSDALAEEPWDIVTVQQASYDSGNYESFALLSELVAYVRARVPSTTKILFHQTWAYAQNSTHGGFKRYNNDQMTMYNAICDCAKRAVKDYGLDGWIPAGTAIQYGRATALGDNLNCDGHHLNGVGKYIAACTWYEYIFHRSVVGNRFAGEANATEKKLAQKSAHKAVKRSRK